MLRAGSSFWLGGVGLVLLGLVGGPGCETVPGIDGPATQPLADGPAPPAWPELVEKYNDRLRYFTQLQARVGVELQWDEYDPDEPEAAPRRRREHGEGKLFYLPPKRTMLTIEKLSKVYLWAGSNAEELWLIDRTRDEKRVAYVQPQTGESSRRLTVDPTALPHVLGLLPLPEGLPESQWPTIEASASRWSFVIPRTAVRVWLNPDTLRPDRLEIASPQGAVLLRATMERSISVETPRVQESDWPVLPQTLAMQVFDDEGTSAGTMTLRITSAHRPTRIRDAWFQLEPLVQALRVGEVIRLD